jgi:hypothetical protein
MEPQGSVQQHGKYYVKYGIDQRIRKDFVFMI